MRSGRYVPPSLGLPSLWYLARKKRGWFDLDNLQKGKERRTIEDSQALQSQGQSSLIISFQGIFLVNFPTLITSGIMSLYLWLLWIWVRSIPPGILYLRSTQKKYMVVEVFQTLFRCFKICILWSFCFRGYLSVSWTLTLLLECVERWTIASALASILVTVICMGVATMAIWAMKVREKY